MADTNCNAKIVIDLDGTITDASADTSVEYKDKTPNLPVIEALRKYHADGFWIVIHTARNMRTYNGNLGEINVHTLPVITAWLEKHNVPFDEIIVGKPWCGDGGFYVDDRALRPDEFANLSYDQILLLLGDKAEQ